MREILIAVILLSLLIAYFPAAITGFLIYTPDTSACWYNSSHPTYPDWNITETADCTVSDGEIELAGNLTVYGNLTLDNVTLIFNTTTDGERKIEVYNGGLMNITASSNITSNDTSYEFLFTVNSGSIFEMRDSYLRECGYNSSNPGLNIETNNTIFQNNSIRNSHYGIYLNNSDNNIITNNTIRFNYDGIFINYSSDNNIENNTINNNVYGLEDTYGIFITTNSPNNTINNNEIYSNMNGIAFTDSLDNNITNNTIYSNLWNGLTLHNSNNSTVINNIIYSNSNFGIDIEDSANKNILTNNTIYSNQRGINLDDSSSNDFTDNTIYNNSHGFYLLSSSNNTLLNNTAYNNSNDGFIFVTNSNNNTLTNNTAYNNSNNGFLISSSLSNNLTNNTARNNTYRGIALVPNSYYNNITGNYLYENAYDGIWLQTNSSNNTVYNNSIYENDYGVHNENSDNNIISNNIVYENTVHGIWISTTSINATVGNNTIYDTNYGIVIENSDNNTANNNTVYNINLDGIYLEGSNNNTLGNNDIYDNTRYGIHLLDSNLTTISRENITNSTSWDIYLDNSNITADRVILYKENATFEGKDFSMKNLTSIPTDPTDYQNISRYLSITNTSSTGYINLTWYYNDSGITDENRLKIMKHNGTWYEEGGIPYTIPNYINKNITSFSTFAILENVTQYCGDGICGVGESCLSCFADCGPCPGGGLPPTPPEEPPVIETEDFTFGEVEPGEFLILDIEADISVVLINVSLNASVNNVTISLEKEEISCDSLGIQQNSRISYNNVEKLVYECFDIYKENLEDNDIESVEIVFKVNKTWIYHNDIDTYSIELLRYHYNKWNSLPTEQIETPTGYLVLEPAEEYIYYKAISPGLTPFVIVGLGITPLEECFIWIIPCWLLILIIILILLIIWIYYKRRKKKRKKRRKTKTFK